MKQTLAIALFGALPLLAQAQQVWRCGPEGRSYSSVPCAEGRPLEVPEARPAADLSAARAQAARDVRLAETLRKERLATEATQRGSGITGIGPGATLKPASTAPTRQRPKKKRSSPAAEATDTWRAVAPSTRGAKG